MNSAELNDFVYLMRCKDESIGVWAQNLHEPMTDHATHIADIRKRTAASFGLVKAETASIRNCSEPKPNQYNPKPSRSEPEANRNRSDPGPKRTGRRTIHI